MKVTLIALAVLLSIPLVIGSTATAVSTSVRPAPADRLFTWVPASGFPDHYPYGQCTWWAAYNRHVTWNGNARDWLANAAAAGISTSSLPTFGAIAVYKPGEGYSDLGHVGIVIAVAASTYTVSEMNFIGWGRVNTRVETWPDPHIDGFIPLTKAEAR